MVMDLTVTGRVPGANSRPALSVPSLSFRFWGSLFSTAVRPFTCTASAAQGRPGLSANTTSTLSIERSLLS